MPDIKILASDLGFPEGPVWMADGSVILGEISGKKVTRVARDGSKTEIGKAGGGPNGVATGPDGALYVCNNGGAVYQTTPSSQDKTGVRGLSGDCSGIICFTPDGSPVPLDGTGGAMAPGCQALR